jgi:hypothetical protein
MGSFFKKGFGKLKDVFKGNEKEENKELDQDSEVQNQNLIFNELSRFVSYFVILQVPFEKAHDVLLNLCK